MLASAGGDPVGEGEFARAGEAVDKGRGPRKRRTVDQREPGSPLVNVCAIILVQKVEGVKNTGGPRGVGCVGRDHFGCV